MGKYAKAIVAAVGGVVALIVVIATGGEVDSIPVMAETIIAALTAILVFVVPNKPDDTSEPDDNNPNPMPSFGDK